MKVNYYSISDSKLVLQGKGLSDADANTLRENEQVREQFYSYTTLRAHTDGKLYIGTTHMKNRLLWIFDPATKKFEDLGYDKQGEYYDVKIHRSLEYDSVNDVFYGISAALHGEDEYAKSPGSQVFTLDVKTHKIEFIGRPMEHEYTQTITFDPKRRLLYGFTYHTFSFYVFDVDKRKTIFTAKPGSISHLSAIDDSGCFWGTWGRNQHWIFKYDPAKNDIEWTRKKFPEGGHSYMYPGAGPIDCMFNGGDGYLYVALETGSLVRMDPRTIECEYLGRPSPHPRMPAIVMGDDGLFYGACGDDYNVHIFTFDRKTRAFHIIAKVANEKERCFRPHDIALLDGKIYIGETDNGNRTGYLWEVDLNA